MHNTICPHPDCTSAVKPGYLFCSRHSIRFERPRNRWGEPTSSAVLAVGTIIGFVTFGMVVWAVLKVAL